MLYLWQLKALTFWLSIHRLAALVYFLCHPICFISLWQSLNFPVHLFPILFSKPVVSECSRIWATFIPFHTLEGKSTVLNCPSSLMLGTLRTFLSLRKFSKLWLENLLLHCCLRCSHGLSCIQTTSSIYRFVVVFVRLWSKWRRKDAEACSFNNGMYIYPAHCSSTIHKLLKIAIHLI